MTQKNESINGAIFKLNDKAEVRRYTDGWIKCRGKMGVLWSVLLVGFAFSVSNEAFAKHEMDPKLRDVDANNDGVITREEWRVASDKAFNDRDWSGDGTLSGDELKPGARRKPVSSDSFRELDRNNDGVVSRSEWQGSTDAFNHLDLDKNGSLSAEEVNHHFKADGFQELDSNSDGSVSRAEWPNSSRSFKALDRDGDGKLTRDEFFNPEQTSSAVFSELNVNNDSVISRSEWKGSTENFNRLDINGDNVLTEKEFNGTQSKQGSLVEQIFQEVFKKR